MTDLAASVLGEVVPLRELFATIFFVSVGILLQPAALLAGWPIVLVLLLLMGLLLAAGWHTPLSYVIHRIPVLGSLRAVERGLVGAGRGRPKDEKKLKQCGRKNAP